MENKMTNFDRLSNFVIEGKIEELKELVQKEIKENIDPMDIINKGMMKGMDVVGERFKNGDMFVPEVLMSANTMKAGMNILRPLLTETNIKSRSLVALGTAKGDLHDIGKNLVGMILESAGLEVVDLGVDVSTEVFINAVREKKPAIIGMSALLTTTMTSMKDVINSLKEEGIRDNVKVIIGGAPITPSFAEEVGADGWAPDAVSAKDLTLQMLKR